jgi:hypothetical protein
MFGKRAFEIDVVSEAFERFAKTVVSLVAGYGTFTP